MVYPFEVNNAITSFGEQADLIFVFFDPMGQALCKRTLNIVEKLSEKCGDKLRFYLSKADEAGRETDRQRVMMQIVQELCRRPGLNKCGFEMPTIYIPNPQKPSRCVNQIDEVCETIEKSINQAVQKTLNQLEKDCDLIISTISNTLDQDRFIISTFTPGDLDALVGEGLAKPLYLSTVRSYFSALCNIYIPPVVHGVVVYLWEWIPEDWQIMFVLIFGALSYLLFFLAKYFARQSNKTLTKREKKKLVEDSDYVQDSVKAKKRKLYEEYLQQCAAEYDF
ncbi:hypothetical protein E1301_Tti016172 [Triplophysa tibetana]|uniref:Uncharacterized protein n=1 Tax=Triplophysa tibetana TaxID=1572043 RepID=A0A5A9P309_9TELE|nr:hypothetical protein E1301_Tti016172 [Triplophysa tibetana]